MSIKFQAKHKSGFTVDAPFRPFSFPAGEAHVKIDEGVDLNDYEYFLADIRGYDAQDFFLLAMWSKAIDQLADEIPGLTRPRKYLLLPYLPGARADRGVPLGAEVYASLINSFNVVTIGLDPHSPIMPTMLREPLSYRAFPFERIIKREIQDSGETNRPRIYDGVIAPDHGAVDRATRAANVMGVPVFLAGKTRDFESGKLTGFHMEDELPATGKFLIVDDICDGGGTFNGLADAIKKTNPDVKLDLWVTHGVFSQGFDALEDRFDTIHTTDSYLGTRSYTNDSLEIATCEIKVHSVTPYLYNEVSIIAGGVRA